MRAFFFFLFLLVVGLVLYLIGSSGTTEPSSDSSVDQPGAGVVQSPGPESFSSETMSGITYQLQVPTNLTVSQVTPERYEFTYIGPESEPNTKITNGYLISSYLATSTSSLVEYAATHAETEYRSSTTIAGYRAIEFEAQSELGDRLVRHIAVAVPGRDAVIDFSLSAFGDAAEVYKVEMMNILRTLEVTVDAIGVQTNEAVELVAPTPNETITSPLTISGEARGTWFFEADFPVLLTDWDGRIIAESFASAGGEWMTEAFVPFEGTLEFESPYQPGDPEFMRRGTLILQRSNPSGLPENDAVVEVPVRFETTLE